MGESVIDFQNASYVKLGQVPLTEVSGQIDPLLIEGEQLFAAFKGIARLHRIHF
jgi:hypothetical protein